MQPHMQYGASSCIVNGRKKAEVPVLIVSMQFDCQHAIRLSACDWTKQCLDTLYSSQDVQLLKECKPLHVRFPVLVAFQRRAKKHILGGVSSRVCAGKEPTPRSCIPAARLMRTIRIRHLRKSSLGCRPTYSRRRLHLRGLPNKQQSHGRQQTCLAPSS